MKRRFIIIGAGISGLALGWFLKKRFADDLSLTILEATERVGGWIHSSRDQGFLFETGPRSCRTKGAGLETLQLVEELGIDSQVINASSEAEKRFLYADGKLQVVPTTLFSFLKSPLMKGMLPALWKEWQIPPSDLEDESIRNFIERRLGKAIAEKFIDPLVSGIYAGNIETLSVQSCFPELHKFEQEHGSLIKGMLRKKKNTARYSPFVESQRKKSIFSFKEGMETLVKALQLKLNQEIMLSSAVKAIHCHHSSVEVELQNGKKLSADHVFLAVPASIAAILMKNIDPISSEKMEKSPYASVAVVNMGWHEKVLKQEGFGYLVPSSEKQKVLGVVFDSSTFKEQNQNLRETRLTAMIGGMHFKEVEKMSTQELKEVVKEAIHKHLGISLTPDVTRVVIAKQAIAQYEVGHKAKLLEIESSLKKTSASRISLIGSAWYGVAVNDCIAEAKKIAATLPSN